MTPHTFFPISHFFVLSETALPNQQTTYSMSRLSPLSCSKLILNLPRGNCFLAISSEDEYLDSRGSSEMGFVLTPSWSLLLHHNYKITKPVLLHAETFSYMTTFYSTFCLLHSFLPYTPVHHIHWTLVQFSSSPQDLSLF